MLKRLGAYPRQNGLALREIGRIEEPFSLDWLERPQLRRQATAELNKSKSHRLRRIAQHIVDQPPAFTR